MNNAFRKHDARGSLQVEELEPGHLYVRVQGHLTSEVGREFPQFARDAAARADRYVVFLDARGLRGFDSSVRDAWVNVVMSERRHIERIAVATQGVFISLSARAASVALKAIGVQLDVVNSPHAFEEMVVRAA